jgi:hypothetical protein
LAPRTDPARCGSIPTGAARPGASLPVRGRGRFRTAPPVPPLRSGLLGERARIDPEAPKIRFDDFQAESGYRRERERRVIPHHIACAERGPTRDAIIGTAGLVARTLLLLARHDGAAGRIATTCGVSLGSVFVLGRESPKTKPIVPAKIREKINRGAPTEDGGHRCPGDPDCDVLAPPERPVLPAPMDPRLRGSPERRADRRGGPSAPANGRRPGVRFEAVGLVSPVGTGPPRGRRRGVGVRDE